MVLLYCSKSQRTNKQKLKNTNVWLYILNTLVHFSKTYFNANNQVKKALKTPKG